MGIYLCVSYLNVSQGEVCSGRCQHVGVCVESKAFLSCSHCLEIIFYSSYISVEIKNNVTLFKVNIFRISKANPLISIQGFRTMHVHAPVVI